MYRITEKMKIGSLDKITIDYAPGAKGNRIVVILLCPGKSERESRHPAAGITGSHLQTLMEMIVKRLETNYLQLKETYDGDFKYDKYSAKNGVMVTNVFKDWYGKGSENGTKPPNRPRCEDVERLKTQIFESKKKLILCFGSVASECWEMVTKCSHVAEDVIAVKCCHIGNKGLNKCIDVDEYGKIIVSGGGNRRQQKENTSKRLAVLANYILSFISGEIEVPLGCYLNILKGKCKGTN